MQKTKSAKRPLRTARQIEAIAHPTRYLMFMALDQGGPMTLSAIAARIGREPSALYRHVKALEAADVVAARQALTATGGRSAQVYEAQVCGMIDWAPSDPDQIRAMAKLAEVALHHAARRLSRALPDRTQTLRGPQADTRLNMVSAELTQDQRARVNGLLSEIEAVFAAAETGEAGSRSELTFALYPG